MESELCRLHDRVGKYGMATTGYASRGRGIETKHRLAFPKKTFVALGEVFLFAHALVWFAARLKEVAASSRKVEKGAVIKTSIARQWTAIMDKLAPGKAFIVVVNKIKR